MKELLEKIAEFVDKLNEAVEEAKAIGEDSDFVFNSVDPEVLDSFEMNGQTIDVTIEAANGSDEDDVADWSVDLMICPRDADGSIISDGVEVYATDDHDEVDAFQKKWNELRGMAKA